jgi:ABC-type oligopeptide transport system substrate-binding subunit
VPISFYLGIEPSLRHQRLRFTPYTDDWQKGKSYEPILERLVFVRPYEELARDAVRRFLQENYDKLESDDPQYLSRFDMLVAAEQALSSVLSWHDSAKQTGPRSKEEWRPIESALRKQLLDEVLLKEIKSLADANDWERVLSRTRRLAITYPSDEDRARIFRPVADMIQSALKDPTGSAAKKQQALKGLAELEREFPNNPAFQPISNLLITNAKDFLRVANELIGDGSDPNKLRQAQAYIERAKEIWPQLPELQAMERRLNLEHPILRVGVRGGLPQYFSPGRACTDNERRAVDLLFESLVKHVPDEKGGYRYVPALAQSRPKVRPLGRQFELPRNAFWSDGQRLNSTDLDVSLKLMQNGKGVGRSRVWGELLADLERKSNPFEVTVRMKQGFLDPLALMSFKVLPRDYDVLSEEFARRPVTSGPYRLDPRQSDEKNRPCVIFTANTSYGLRPAKRGLPHIQEIRFYAYNKPLDELSNGQLDLVLDLTAKEAAELREKQRSGSVPIEIPSTPPTMPNRRIYFLAINTSHVPDAKIRRALAFAINREGLLDKHFRSAPKEKLHHVLYGPFPSGTWACNANVRDHANKDGHDLHDPDKARTLSHGAKLDALKLKYPVGNPALDEAIKDMAAQVKEVTGITLEPTPCSGYQLHEDVEHTQDYDVAYYSYDFPDESYWLAPLLGPPPGTEGDKSAFKFAQSSLFNLLAKEGSYRNFAEVRLYQTQIHALLNDEMPFVPLWQLDPLMAYRRDVHPSGLDPLDVFVDIEQWRVQLK